MWIRILAAAAVFVSALIHLEQWILGYRDNAFMGPAMLTNFIGGLVIVALLLLWRDHWLPWLLTIAFGAATFGAFLITATVGLFGVHETWTAWEVWVAMVVEIVAIIAGIAGLLLRKARVAAP